MIEKRNKLDAKTWEINEEIGYEKSGKSGMPKEGEKKKIGCQRNVK